MRIQLCTAGIFIEVSNASCLPCSKVQVHETQKETKKFVLKKHKLNGSLCTVEGTKKSDSISKPNFGVATIQNSCKVIMERKAE